MACDQSRLRLAAEASPPTEEKKKPPEEKKEKKNEDEEQRLLVEKRIHDLQKEVSCFSASSVLIVLSPRDADSRRVH